MRNKVILILIFLVYSPLFVLAQVVERDSTVANVYAFNLLQKQLDSLEFHQNEIYIEIDDIRKKIAEESEESNNIKVLSDKILMLENSIFDIKSKMGVIESKQLAMSQEYIINNLAKNETSGALKNLLNTNILVNSFFSSNLSDYERELFLSEDANCDNLFFSLRDTIEAKLTIINRTIRTLRTTQSRPAANELYNTADIALEKIEECNSILSGKWDKVYENKLIAYKRLLNKLNVADSVVNMLSAKVEKISEDKKAIVDKKITPAFYSYSKEHELILTYEKILAERMAYVRSLDSLNIALTRIKNQTFDVDVPKFPEQDYVRFTPAVEGGKWVHSFANPVKEVSIPTYGNVFMIKLMDSPVEISRISSLKNINPVRYFVNEKGEMEYYVGLYATRKEAAEDVNMVKELGFDGAITEWKKGGKVVGDKIIPIKKDQ